MRQVPDAKACDEVHGMRKGPAAMQQSPTSTRLIFLRNCAQRKQGGE
jgi:hypothetical protein